MSKGWRPLLVFAILVSASCTSPAGNGDDGELSFSLSAPAIAGCGNLLSVIRTTKDAAATSCDSCGPPLDFPFGCTRKVHRESLTLKSLTCNGTPCSSAALESGANTVSFTPASEGSLVVRAVAEVDGDEVEDTITFHVAPGPCPVPRPVDAGRPVPPPPDAYRECRHDAPFAPPMQLPASANQLSAAHPSLGNESDPYAETTLVFDVPIDGGARGVFRIDRASRLSPFGASVPVFGLEGPGDDEARLTTSPDYPFVFVSDRDDAGRRLFVSHVDGGATSLAGAGADGGEEGQPFLLGDAMWFGSNRSGDWEIYQTTWDGAAVGSVAHVSELGSSYFDGYPVVSSDGLTVFFASNRPGSRAGINVWTATRANRSLAFGAPTPVAEISTDADDVPGWLSEDGCRLYYTRIDLGFSALFVAERLP